MRVDFVGSQHKVATVPFGKWDIRKAISLGMKSELHRHIDQVFETAMKFMEHRSTPENMYTQFIIILDFEGFSLRQLASKEGMLNVEFFYLVTTVTDFRFSKFNAFL